MDNLANKDKKDNFVKKLGVVILNYNSYQDTINCVESFCNQKFDDYKIYIVDNASKNESVKVLSEKFSERGDVEITVNDVNGGFSAGNNIGLKKAVEDGCEYVLCVNSDVLFKYGCIEKLVGVLDDDKRCAVVGPKVYCADGSVQNANKGILTANVLLLRKKGFRIFDWFGLEKKYTYRSYKYDKRLILDGMVSGCCFLIRACVLKQVDYLDENVFLYHEEDILGAKIRATKQYYVCLEPTAEITHLGGKSTSGDNEFVRYHKFKSSMYYLWNYTDVSKFKYKLLSSLFSFMWFVKSVGNKKYRCYYKQLKKDYADIMHNGR